MPEPRIVKRYANRKLYDTQSSHYVTLDQIAEMIRRGEEVRVLDNNSKEDLTSVTLAQIIFEEEKRQKSFLPLTAMRHIIQSGGASLSELAQQAQARVTSLFRKGDSDSDREAAPTQPDGATAAEGDGRKEETSAVREFLERSQQTIDEWQRRVDDRVRQLLETISPFAAIEKEVARLRERIEELERQVRALRTPGGS
ncbi:MAG: polyhydroxyalkanoate synthesis regulator DNA-binding domain-containing protein [Myxococcales bacterium]|nr:transcriptional regulator [Myxococcota bacterium]MDW8280118.1 polyhydroxyalkanoate synthesis regulator DNA-binding domain-containing protein [Myxococcales bacterium]